MRVGGIGLMTNKFTPAPWEVKVIEHPFSLPERKFGERIIPAIAGTHKQYVVQTAWEHGQAKAKVSIFGQVIAVSEPEPITYVSAWNKHDAYLAAAAPDLLDALIEMIELCTFIAPDISSNLIDNAHAAIAKATGNAE
jgi:hypothetical protein